MFNVPTFGVFGLICLRSPGASASRSPYSSGSAGQPRGKSPSPGMRSSSVLSLRYVLTVLVAGGLRAVSCVCPVIVAVSYRVFLCVSFLSAVVFELSFVRIVVARRLPAGLTFLSDYRSSNASGARSISPQHALAQSRDPFSTGSTKTPLLSSSALGSAKYVTAPAPPRLARFNLSDVRCDSHCGRLFSVSCVYFSLCVM